MTIDELIERLEDYRDELGGDTEVRLMTQQNWPFENTVAGLASGAEINEREDGDDEDVDDDRVVFIVEGQTLRYARRPIETVRERPPGPATTKPKRPSSRVAAGGTRRLKMAADPSPRTTRRRTMTAKKTNTKKTAKKAKARRPRRRRCRPRPRTSRDQPRPSRNPRPPRR